MIAAWGPDRVADLAALTTAALPTERLSATELSVCLWTTLVRRWCCDTRAAAAVVRARSGTSAHRGGPWCPWRADGSCSGRRRPGWPSGGHRAWAAEAPYYLWPGVPIEATGALALLETSVRRRRCGARHGLLHQPPRRSAAGRRRAGGDDGAGGARSSTASGARRVERAIEQGGCVGALAADGTAVGFGHSVSRAGWIGPIGTDPAAGRGGIGVAVMSCSCAELRPVATARRRFWGRADRALRRRPRLHVPRSRRGSSASPTRDSA